VSLKERAAHRENHHKQVSFEFVIILIICVVWAFAITAVDAITMKGA